MRSINLLKLSVCFGLSSFVYAAQKGQGPSVQEQWEAAQEKCKSLMSDQVTTVRTTLQCTQTTTRLHQKGGVSIPFGYCDSFSATLQMKGKCEGEYRPDTCGTQDSADCPTYVEEARTVTGQVVFENCRQLVASPNPIEACEDKLKPMNAACDQQEAQKDFSKDSKANLCSYENTGVSYSCESASSGGKAQQQDQVQVYIEQEVVQAEKGACAQEVCEQAQQQCHPAPACEGSTSGSSCSGTSEDTPSSPTSGTSEDTPSTPSSPTSGTSGTTPSSFTSMSTSEVAAQAKLQNGGQKVLNDLFGGAEFQGVKGVKAIKEGAHLNKKEEKSGLTLLAKAGDTKSLVYRMQTEGLKVGDVVSKINGNAVTNVKELAFELQRIVESGDRHFNFETLRASRNGLKWKTETVSTK